MAQIKTVSDVYKSVVQDVVDGVRESFQDDGLDEQVLQELKQLWENKLRLSKALESIPIEPRNYGIQTIATNLSTTNNNNNTRIVQQHIQQQQQQFYQNHLQLNQSHYLQQSLHNPYPAHMQSINNLNNVSVLNLATHNLSNAALSATQSIPPAYMQHLNNLSYLVPQTSHQRPIVIQPQSIGGMVFGLNDPTLVTPVPLNQQNNHQNNAPKELIQLDGLNDSSSSEEDDEDGKELDKDGDDDPLDLNNLPNGEEAEEEPLNSGDDDANDTDAQDLFDVDNVIVCQFDKINRSKAKWKLHLKDGIMNLSGRDYIFQKATGDAEF